MLLERAHFAFKPSHAIQNTRKKKASNNGQFFDAGDALVVSSPLGTYTTLTTRTVGEATFYDTPDPLENVPTDLTIDIPGNEFPAFSNAAIPNGFIIDDLSYPTDAITETSEYTWTPTGATNTAINLYINTVQGADSRTLISCTLVDDGSFQLPDDVIAKVGSFSDGTVESAFVDIALGVQTGNAFVSLTHSRSIPLQ